MPLTLKRKGEFVEKADLTEDELRVVVAFEEHIALMLTDDWYLTVHFTKVDEEAMATQTWPEYRKAIVEVDLPNISTQWEYLNHYVRHELLHIIVWNFFDIAGTLAYKNVGRALGKLEEQVIYLLEHMPLWSVLYEKTDRQREES
jgi:hypothetical protein